jgi:hypothetical protein
MQRQCTHCERPFTADDLAREESKGMEAERKQLGLQGVRFFYYNCPACQRADIFVDVLPVPGEAPEAFQTRRAELEKAVRQLHDDRVGLVLGEGRAGSHHS